RCEKMPERSTLHRWLAGKSVPQSAHQLLCLAAALDLDPVALWDFVPQSFGALCIAVVEAALRNRWKDLFPALAFSKQFLGPTTNWPPSEMAEEYFERRWTIQEFIHPAVRRGYFGTVRITPSQL